MLYVQHMHILVCRVFKWNYEQLLYGQTFLPTDTRFARANAPLKAQGQKILNAPRTFAKTRVDDGILACYKVFFFLINIIMYYVGHGVVCSQDVSYTVAMVKCITHAIIENL